MRTFIDEREPLQTITESQLHAEYTNLLQQNEIDPDITFGQYINNCLTYNNGTLIERR